MKKLRGSHWRGRPSKSSSVQLHLIVIIHLNQPSRPEGEHYDAYEEYVNNYYATLCGRPDAAALLTVEVLFEDAAADHHPEVR